MRDGRVHDFRPNSVVTPPSSLNQRLYLSSFDEANERLDIIKGVVIAIQSLTVKDDACYLTTQRNSRNRAGLQVLPKAYDPIDFLESQRHVKHEAIRIIEFAIAGKFGAAVAPCPFLAF